MHKAQQDLLARLWPARAADLPLASPEQAVILASIVEAETPLAAERPRVAGVYLNRLKRGMKLQADPTVISGKIGRASCRESACQYVSISGVGVPLKTKHIDSEYNKQHKYT